MRALTVKLLTLLFVVNFVNLIIRLFIITKLTIKLFEKES